MLCGMTAMMQASGSDGVAFDPFSFQQDGLTSSEVNVGKVGRRAVHTKRYEKQVPGHHIQVDVKFLSFQSKNGANLKRYQYTAIDDATR